MEDLLIFCNRSQSLEFSPHLLLRVENDEEKIPNVLVDRINLLDFISKHLGHFIHSHMNIIIHEILVILFLKVLAILSF